MKLSVCVTHYNRPERLARTLESLCRQTRQPDEVLLWDDKSPKDPTDVAMTFQNRFRSFTYHRNQANLGMPGNLNAVVSRATGDLIANLHDADEFDPRLLEKWEAVLQRNPRAGLAFCGLHTPVPPRDGRRDWLHDFSEYTDGAAFFEQVYVGSCGSPIWGTVMARREVYQRFLPFDAQFKNWADVDMWMRVCGAYGIAYVREPLIILDDSPTSLRMFGWKKFLITHRMPITNIFRIAKDETTRERWLRRQTKWTRAQYVRNLAGRLVRGELKTLWEGLGLWREVLIKMPAKDWCLPGDGDPPSLETVNPGVAGQPHA